MEQNSCSSSVDWSRNGHVQQTASLWFLFFFFFLEGECCFSSEGNIFKGTTSLSLSHAHVYTQTLTHSWALTRTPTHSLTHSLALSLIHTYTHTHTRTTHPHTHTRTHTHSICVSGSVVWSVYLLISVYNHFVVNGAGHLSMKCTILFSVVGGVLCPYVHVNWTFLGILKLDFSLFVLIPFHIGFCIWVS